ncbi:MAG: mechanosensitive ion channel family protein [Xenococcus sp. (in: cyanobacteria)]
MRKNTNLKKFRLHRITAFATTSLVSVFVSCSFPIVAQEAAVEEAPTEATITEATITEEASPESAKTTKDPKISLTKLTLLVKPLTLGQLENEAAGWQVLLQEKVQQISDAEIALEDQQAVESGTTTTTSNLKAEEIALVARFNIVLDELDAKGGDSSSYRQYIDAISGLEKYITNSDGLGVQLVSWLTSEDGGISLAVDVAIGLAKIGGILVITLIAAPRLGNLTDNLLGRVGGISTLFRGFIVTIVKRGVFVIGALIALAVLGVDLGPILALVGGASFVLAFALQSNLGNFASGLMLLINKPFDVGDEIKVAGYWAYVDSISLASTKIKDFGGSIITLPNNTVWGSDIINYTHSDIRKLGLAINIKFQQDLDKIYDMWMEITSAHPKVLDDPAPAWFPWNGHYDYFISVNLTAWSKTEDFWGVYLELLKELQKRIIDLNIELAAPQQEIKLDQYLPEAIAKQIQQNGNTEQSLPQVESN